MAKQKLTSAQIAELRAAYEEWNPHAPNSESVDDLAARFGISKQTLYNYRDRWLGDERRKREKAARDGNGTTNNMSEAIVFLTAELARARARVEALELEVLELNEQLESRDQRTVS